MKFFNPTENLAPEKGVVRIMTSNILAVGPGFETTGAIDHICVTYDKAKVIRHRKLSSDLLILSTDHDPIFIDVEI